MEVSYPFEEFCRHYEELYSGDYFGRDRCFDEPDEEFSFEKSLCVVADYMKEQYSDDRERFFKVSRFVIIMNYLSHHLSEFDRGDYAVCGSERVGALVNEHLLHAIHQLFTSPELLKKNIDPTPEEVMSLADTLRQESTA